MKSILIIPLLLLLLSACSSSKPNTVGNGVVDPAYIVSSVLLSNINDTEMDDAALQPTSNTGINEVAKARR